MLEKGFFYYGSLLQFSHNEDKHICHWVLETQMSCF